MNNSECLVENEVTGSRTGQIWIKGVEIVEIVKKIDLLSVFLCMSGGE